MIAVLSGGVGAARLLAGLQQVVDPGTLTAIVNVGDDTMLHGLAISPDLDTITYTLAGAIDPERGWGLAGETWRVMASLERFAAVRPPGSRAGGTWFGLGDQDLATHLYRTHRLAEGASLTEVTAEIAAAYGVTVRLLPVTDDPLHTMLTVAGEGEIEFQEYFVGRQHGDPHQRRPLRRRRGGAPDRRRGRGGGRGGGHRDRAVQPDRLHRSAAGRPRGARAHPGSAGADGRRLAHRRRPRRSRVPPTGCWPSSATRSASSAWPRSYRDLAATMVIDEADRALAPEVEAEGLRCVVTDTVMRTPAVAAALGAAVLDAVGRDGS